MTQAINKNEIIKSQENAITYQTSNGQSITLTKSAIKQITNDNKYITDGEIELFINLCKYQGLNPFIKEAFLVKYDSSKPAQQVTSLGAFMRIADEQPKYEGIEDGIIVQTADKKIVDRTGCILYPNETLLGGWARVYRSDRKTPSVARLSLKEYSKGQSTWNQMPATMVNKCSKVASLRKAFPSAYQGLYEEDELKATIIPSVPTNDNSQIYDIDDTEVNNDTISEDVVVSEQIVEEMTTQETNNGTVEENDPNISVIFYGTYLEEKDKWLKEDYPDGRKAYQNIDGKKTIRVRLK